ncbi:hypothetical protein NPIL_506571 [Nephila pilipes]|uniref:Uncharacterized protein n=1 Tax=Nephila pilipes TaxID=299642 RepID=A0A8X6QBB3_NEPPI|nr:hypothetical protein NPIL_506571 [Nephila pilipes]
MKARQLRPCIIKANQTRIAELVVTGGYLHRIPHGHPANGAVQILPLVLDTEPAAVSGHSPGRVIRQHVVPRRPKGVVRTKMSGKKETDFSQSRAETVSEIDWSVLRSNTLDE